MGDLLDNGVIIDYQLPEDWTDKMIVKLEVLRADGTVIRTLSSAKQINVAKCDGGPAPEPRLPAKAKDEETIVGAGRRRHRGGRESLQGAVPRGRTQP